MKGAPQDIIGNDDTLDSTGRTYFGDHLTADAIAATQAHPLYRHIQRLNLIRRGIPALQKAPLSQVNEWGSGMSFVRDFNNGESYVVVGLAIGGDQAITVGNVRSGPYVDAVTGNRLSAPATVRCRSRFGPIPPVSMSLTVRARSARMECI